MKKKESKKSIIKSEQPTEWYGWEFICQSEDEAVFISESFPSYKVFSSSWYIKKILGVLENYRLEKRQNSIAAPPRPCDLPLLCAITNAKSIVECALDSGINTFDNLSQSIDLISVRLHASSLTVGIGVLL